MMMCRKKWRLKIENNNYNNDYTIIIMHYSIRNFNVSFVDNIAFSLLVICFH